MSKGEGTVQAGGPLIEGGMIARSVQLKERERASALGNRIPLMGALNDAGPRRSGWPLQVGGDGMGKEVQGSSACECVQQPVQSHLLAVVLGGTGCPQFCFLPPTLGSPGSPTPRGHLHAPQPAPAKELQLCSRLAAQERKSERNLRLLWV